MPGIRKYRRDTSEVSCCLKYVIFGVNVLFWVSPLEYNLLAFFALVISGCVSLSSRNTATSSQGLKASRLPNVK